MCYFSKAPKKRISGLLPQSISRNINALHYKAYFEIVDT